MRQQRTPGTPGGSGGEAIHRSRHETIRFGVDSAGFDHVYSTGEYLVS